MGKKIERNRSKTLPSSPTHSSSSSSSDFEFRISISPRKSSAALCPADELFYKGQILPLQLSPRISMVRTLLLASSSTSSSSDHTTTTASPRDSSSSTDSTSSSFAADLSLLAAGDPCCHSSRPSSVTEDDDHNNNIKHCFTKKSSTSSSLFSKFSNVFKKDSSVITTQQKDHNNVSENKNTKIMNSSSAKHMIRKYIKKVKPLYEKLSSKQHHGNNNNNNNNNNRSATCVGGISPVLETTGPVQRTSSDILLKKPEKSTTGDQASAVGVGGSFCQSFSGNLKPSKLMKRVGYVASCPSSMRSSPSHSGVLTRAGLPVGRPGSSNVASTSTEGSCSSYSSETSTMEELQNAIQGAIAHCKNSMLQNSSSSFGNINNNNNINNNKNKCKATFQI